MATLILREVKGTPLTNAEVDSNFVNLNTDITNHVGSGGSNTHPDATTSVSGFMTAADKTKLDGIAAEANKYVLPVATNSILGGVKQGSNVTIAADGTISANVPTINVGVATVSTAGIVKPGNSMSITQDGTLDVSIPIASATVAGVVKQGSNITIAQDGTISANVPQAGLSVTADTSTYANRPIAFLDAATGTATTLHTNTNLSINPNTGVFNANGISVGGTTIVDSNRQLINVTSVDAATKQVLNNAGVGKYNYVVKTANYTAVSGDMVIADTTAGAFTVTLPATPSTGDYVMVADGGNTFGTNVLTVARNGSLLQGLTSDLVLATTGMHVQFVFNGSSWRAFYQVAVNTYSGDYQIFGAF